MLVRRPGGHQGQIIAKRVVLADVMTGKGAKGGYEGWLDAGTELYD